MQVLIERFSGLWIYDVLQKHFYLSRFNMSKEIKSAGEKRGLNR